MTNDETMTKHEKLFVGEHATQPQEFFGIRFSGSFRASGFGLRASFVIAIALLCSSHAWSQTLTNAPTVTNSLPAESAALPSLEEGARKWAFSASVYGYLVPDDQSYAQATGTIRVTK